ncbi:Aquaporin-like protein [Mycena venus]|uniref:Aquaporin-like protein n=1 Tax=Mycena venus TaxID=2733690 RepID=A0A8H6X814_9AGAR|nr:Aquaporin-like protein [Mycena venus]
MELRRITKHCCAPLHSGSRLLNSKEKMAVTVSNANADRVVYMSDLHKRGPVLAGWERLRHGKLHWLAEAFAEMMGVFFYVYAGVGSQAVFVIGGLTKQAGLSCSSSTFITSPLDVNRQNPCEAVLQVGFAYACGILFAISICSATSGGHFNPCITIVMTLFKGFPPLKCARYLVAQILGGYLACLFVYLQYSTIIHEIEAALGPELATINFTPNGPAGIFGFYLLPGSSVGHAFVNEFVCDFLIAMVIFGAIDPSNVLVPPSGAPFLIALAYGVMIWGFSAVGLAANTARDLGGRFAAMTIWGTAAAGPSGYSAITALTNIPATILAYIVYELMFVDSDRVVSQAQREFHDVHALHRRLGPAAHATADDESGNSIGMEKEHVGTAERV